MAQEVTPPDMVGAGIAAPQGTNASSLMAQLRQGGLPGDMVGLRAMPQQTPGQSYASALAGGVAQMQGQPNPIAGMQRQQFQQAQQQAQMHQRIIEQRMRREEGVLSLSKDLLQSENEEARMVGARGVMNFMKANGQQVPESLVKSLATRRMDTKEMGDVLREMTMGVDDAQIALRHPNLDPQTRAQLRASAKSDDTRRLLGLPTQREEQAEVLKLKKLDAEVMEVQFPELKGNAELQLAVEMAHRKINAGKGYREGTKDTQRLAYDFALEQVRSLKERELAIKEAAEARKNALMATQQRLMESVLGGGGPLSGGGGTPGFEPSVSIGPSGPTVTFKPQTQVKQGIADLQNTEAIFDSIKQMSGQLMTAPSAVEAGIQGAKLKFGSLTKSHTLAAAYDDSKQAFLGVLSRSLGGERGVLTDRDIARIDRMLPGFGDTKKIRDLKVGLIENLLKTSIEAKQSLLAGQPVSGDFRQRVEGLLRAAEEKAEGPVAPTSPLTAPRSLRVRDRKSGRTGTMTLQPGEPVPEGVEVIK